MLDLLPESVIAHGLTIMRGLADEMQVLLTELNLEKLPIGIAPFGGRSPQTTILLVFPQPAAISPGVVPITRPVVFLGSAHHLRPHGVEFNVAHAGEQVAIGLNEAGAMAPFPESAGAAVFLVDVLRVATAHDLHRIRHRGVVARCDEKVDMIGHEAISVNGHPVTER